MNALPLRVVKVGGSLLNWPELGSALACWLKRQPPAQTLLLAGGGALVAEIRAADERYGLGERVAHWLAIDALAITATILTAAIEELLIDTADRPPVSVVSPGEFLRNHEPTLPKTRLAESWAVSSDSIAARMAITAGAAELVLLKSRTPPVVAADETHSLADRLAQLARQGYVDPFLAQLAAELPPLRMVNLREEIT
jgi:aspartokinase-like uncharacterized kinase